METSVDTMECKALDSEAWTIFPSELYLRKQKWYEKKDKDVFVALMTNWARVFGALNDGVPLGMYASGARFVVVEIGACLRLIREVEENCRRLVFMCIQI